MGSRQEFKVRCMEPDEVHRVTELILSLQDYQKMECVPRLPTGQDMMNEIVHENESGILVPNNYGTYTAVAVDMSKLDEPNQKYIVGYLMYSQAYSIRMGRFFWMNSFFIQEDYRRHRLGTKFIEYMRLHAISLGIKHVEVPFMNKNTIGQKFYAGYGAFSVNDEYQIMGMKLDD